MRKSEILNLKKSGIVLGDLGGFISLKDTKNGDNRRVFLTNECRDKIKLSVNDKNKMSVRVKQPIEYDRL
jgi:hypothetical protein